MRFLGERETRFPRRSFCGGVDGGRRQVRTADMTSESRRDGYLETNRLTVRCETSGIRNSLGLRSMMST